MNRNIYKCKRVGVGVGMGRVPIMQVPGPILSRGPASGSLVTYSGLLRRFRRKEYKRGLLKRFYRVKNRDGYSRNLICFVGFQS